MQILSPGQAAATVARASLVNRQGDTGWLQLEVSTSPASPDRLQARAAGFSEGFLTSNTIHRYYQDCK